MCWWRTVANFSPRIDRSRFLQRISYFFEETSLKLKVRTIVWCIRRRQLTPFCGACRSETKASNTRDELLARLLVPTTKLWSCRRGAAAHSTPLNQTSFALHVSPAACHYPFKAADEWKVSSLREEGARNPTRFLCIKQDKAGAKGIQGSVDTVIIPQLCRHAQTLLVKSKHSTVRGSDEASR